MDDDYIPAIQLLRRGKVDFESLIADRVPLQRASCRWRTRSRPTASRQGRLADIEEILGSPR
jgi:hypothetical protein